MGDAQSDNLDATIRDLVQLYGEKAVQSALDRCEQSDTNPDNTLKINVSEDIKVIDDPVLEYLDKQAGIIHRSDTKEPIILANFFPLAVLNELLSRGLQSKLREIFSSKNETIQTRTLGHLEGIIVGTNVLIRENRHLSDELTFNYLKTSGFYKLEWGSFRRHKEMINKHFSEFLLDKDYF